MPLKKHHKIIIGSFSSFLIILLVANSVFIYLLYGQLQLSYNQVKSEINELNRENQNQFNEITDNLISTKNDIQTLDSQFSSQLSSINDEFESLGAEFSELKSSVSADFSGIVEDAIKSVVTIKTDVAQGTGFLIADDGYIATNYHVVEGAKAAGVYTYDGKTHSVSLIGYNEKIDVAVLKIQGNYPYLDLADSDDVIQAEKVIAIGNPYGLSFSVSEGIISATHREGPNGLNIYIQTTTELNSGNSGGPLIDKDGDVVGMNNFKLNNGEGLGFALESNSLEKTVNEISQEKLEFELI